MTWAAISSASARVSATHIAINSPTCRILSVTSGGCSDALKPGRGETALIGLTPVRSSAVKTEDRIDSGIWTPSKRAWATGDRTNATSRVLSSEMSPIYCPFPRKKRSSSFLSKLAPTPSEWPNFNSPGQIGQTMRKVFRMIIFTPSPLRKAKGTCILCITSNPFEAAWSRLEPFG